jgi:hypothetical protein
MMRDYTIKGYTWLADIYCYKCGHTLPDIDPEGNDKHAVFSWDEYDEVDTLAASAAGVSNEWRGA